MVDFYLNCSDNWGGIYLLIYFSENWEELRKQIEQTINLLLANDGNRGKSTVEGRCVCFSTVKNKIHTTHHFHSEKLNLDINIFLLFRGIRVFFHKNNLAADE